MGMEKPVAGFNLQQLDGDALTDLVFLQNTVRAQLPDKEWLRENSPEMFLDCLQHHFAIGYQHDGTLVAAGLLVSAGNTGENIQSYLTQDIEIIEASCNLKLVLVAPEYRRIGIAQAILERLEHQALRQGYKYILCTIHPENIDSQRFFKKRGYERRAQIQSSYGIREVFELGFARRDCKRN